MSLDGIKSTRKLKEKSVREGEREQSGQSKQSRQSKQGEEKVKKGGSKNILWLFVGLTVFIIFIFWLISLRYSFSNLGSNVTSNPELEKAKQSLGGVLEDFTNEIDKLKGSKIFNQLDLSKEEVKDLEERLSEVIEDKEEQDREQGTSSNFLK